MAERASAAKVAADMRPPNFREAVSRLRGIKAKKEKIAGVNGEISDIYAKVEGVRVNKKAARIFLTLDPLEADDRADVLRSLFGLIEVAEWDKGGDLVDDMEGGGGNVVTPNFRREQAPKPGENAAGEDESIASAMDEIDRMGADEEDGGEEDDPPVESAVVKRARQAKERVASHFGQGKAPPPTGTPDPNPYMGDNTDLAGEDPPA